MYNPTNGTVPGVSQAYWLLFLQCGVCRVFKYFQCYQIIHECITKQMALVPVYPSPIGCVFAMWCMSFI